MRSGVLNGEEGFSAFRSEITRDYLYAHYAPMEVENWQIMLCQPEEMVFAQAHFVRNILFAGCAAIVVIMLLYVWLIFSSENKRSRINMSASKIRKLLLQVNQRFGSIKDALQTIAEAAKSRSAIFVDTDGEDFNYIIPSQEKELLTKDNRKYFVNQILEITKARKAGNAVDLEIISISTNSKMKKENPGFYDFLTSHKISNIVFAALADKKITSAFSEY